MNASLFSFSFIQSWALYGSVALAIPIIIHLLSKSRGQLIKWGTTRFLPDAKPIKMTQLKLTQRLLLILRCLMIILSVAMLAQLYFNASRDNDDTIVLVSKTWFNSVEPSEHKPIYNYLSKHDYQVRWLDNLEKVVVDQSLKTIILHPRSAQSPNIWHQLSIASKHFKRAKQFLVFTNATSLQFEGEKALIPQPIEWFISYASKKSTLDNLLIKPFNVVLYADDGHQSALKYLLPALNAIKQIDVKQLRISVVDKKLLRSIDRPDWLFYLSNQPITSQLSQWLTLGTNIFIDGNTNPSQLQLLQTKVSRGYGLINPITFYQSSLLLAPEKSSEEQQVLWFSENNTPVLTVMTNKRQNSSNKRVGKEYRFAGLFSPQWSNLVTQPQFPLVLKTFLFGELIEEYHKANDQIGVENINQLSTLLYQEALKEQKFIDGLSVEKINNNNADDNYERHLNMLSWLGLGLIILFMLERTISENSLREKLVVTEHD